MGGWGQTAGDLLGERLRYLRGWLLPVGLGSLAAPELLLATAPLFAYLFSNPQEWASWEGPYIHHTAPAVGIVAAAAALGWTRVAVRLRLHRALVALLLAGLLGAEVLVLTGLKLGPEELIRPHWEIYVQSEISPWLEQEERVTEAHRLAAQVPSDASVMADWHTVHLFSGRSQVYSYHQESPEVILPGPAGLTEPLLVQPGVSPDWALVNLEDPDWAVRVQAAGRLEVDRGGDWILFGPGS